jgi:hypothetical protein
VIAVARGLASVRTHYFGDHHELLRIVLNAASPAEADFALHILSETIPERDLLAAVNVREALAELPACPFAMALDTITLARVASLERDRSAWRRRCDGFDLVVLGEGNLCFDVVAHAKGRHTFLTPHPPNGAVLHPDMVELIMEHPTLLAEIVELVESMGLPFAPTFYLSLDDWGREYAEEAINDLRDLF